MSDHHRVALRVGTPERTAVARDLVAHHRAGRLGRAELDARLALAAAATSEDDLRLVSIDLPDVAPPGPAALADRAGTPVPRRNEALGIVFDVTVLLLTMAAFVCTALLFAVTSGLQGGERVALALAAFGSVTVGAGAVHLAHRLYGALAQRG